MSVPPAVPPLRVLTVSTQFASLGGAEAILRGHYQHDAAYGVDSRFICLWEPTVPEWPRTAFLDFSPHLQLRVARRRFGAAFPDFTSEVAVYHTDWGVPYFADLDRSRRRVLYLHSDTPGLDAQLARCLPLVDGCLAVSERLLDRVRTHAADLTADRLLKVDAALDVPPLPERVSRSPDAPFIIGFCGRIATKQKRVDRFPELVRELDRLGFNYRLEFLGDGEERLWLEGELGRNPRPERFVFHGRRSGEEYWSRVRAWDAIVFLSDYEGTPLALLESMAVGVVPFHPRLDSGGDRYASQVATECTYPPGDLAALARGIAWLRSAGFQQRQQLAVAARAVMSPHLGESYRTQCTAYWRRLLELPPRSKPVSRGPWWGDWLTFDQRDRLARWRKRGG